MKHKSNILMVLLLFSLVLVLMGMVSASDNVNETISTTTANSGGDAVDLSTTVDESDDGSLSNVNDNDFSKCNVSGVGSVSDLLESANDNEVLTDSSRDVSTYDELSNALEDSSVSQINIMGDITFSSELSINRTVSINGNNYTLDAQHNSRFFTISANDVIINSIHFKNGYASGDGGAIYNNGILNLTGCIFSSSRATNYGGAIYNNRGSVISAGCNFYSNTAVTYGGAIYNNYGIVNLTGCNFSFNSVDNKYGGAFYTIGGTTNITDCNFSDNSAGDHSGTGVVNGHCAGAIYIEKYDTIYLTGCNFINNTAGRGGAIFSSWYCHTFITGCNFTGNIGYSNYNGATGGAIFVWSTPDMVFNDCTFSGNTANYDGVIIIESSNAILNNCSIFDNTARYGTIYCTGSSSPVFNGCNIYGNNAQRGGAVYTNNPNRYNYFNRCIFTNNNATNDGNEFYLNQGHIIVNNSFILNNQLGTSLYSVDSSRTVSLINVWFGNNESNKNTTVINCNNNVVCNEWLYLINNTNLCDLNPGVPADLIFSFKKYNKVTQTDTVVSNLNLPSVKFNVTSNTGTINNISKLENGQFTINYTPIYKCRNITVSLYHVKLIIFDPLRNITINQLKSLWVYGDEVIINVTISNLTEVDPSIKLNDIEVTWNKLNNISLGKLAAGNYIVSVTYPMDMDFVETVVNATIIVNKKINSLNVSVENVYYPNNATVVVYASVDGNYTVRVNNEDYVVGVVDGQGNVTLPVLGVDTYTVNLIWEDSQNYTNTVNSTVFNVNRQIVFYVNGSVDTTGDGSINNPFKSLKEVLDLMENNYNYTIYIAPNRYVGMNNTNLTIDYNVSISNWGEGEVIFDALNKSRIFIIKANLTVSLTALSLVNGNAESDNGGAIYNNGNLNLTACKLYDNNADYGGAVYIQHGGSLNIFNSEIYKNTAINGAGLYSEGSLTIINTPIYNNTALNKGGALYLTGNDVKSLSGASTIIENNTAIKGSAIYINTENFSLNSVTLLNNLAEVTNISLATVQDKFSLLVNATFIGGDNFLNAIYIDRPTYNNQISLVNVTYMSIDGITTTSNYVHTRIFDDEDTDIYPTVHPSSNQNVIIRLYDGETIVAEFSEISNRYGNIVDIEFENLIIGKNYTLTAYHPKNTYYNDYLSMMNVSLVKIDTEINLTTPVVEYGDDIIITLPDSTIAGGTMNLTCRGSIFSADVINGVAVFSNTKIPANLTDLYSIELVYSGDNNYNGANAFKVLNVTRALPEFDISCEVISYGENATVIIHLPADATGTVFINTTTGNYYTGVDVSIARNATLIMPVSGSYIVNATYSGDSNYLPHNVNCTLFVDRPKSVLNISIGDAFVGNPVLINFTINSAINGELFRDAKGILRVYVGSESYLLNITNGKANLTVPDLAIGNYVIVAIYNGDENYAGTDCSDNFNVSGYETDLNINLSTDEFLVDGSFLVTVNVNETINNAPVYLYIDDELYNILLTADGKVIFNVTGDLAAGMHNIRAVFPATNIFGEAENTTDIMVVKNNPDFTIDAATSSNGEIFITIKLAEDATGKINITYNNAIINCFNLTGGDIPVIVLTGYNPGNYTFNAYYSGDGKYYNDSGNVTVEVGKISDYSMNITSSVIIRGQESTIYVILPDMFGDNGYVNLTVNGESEIIPLAGGKADKKITVTDYMENITVTAYYSGFDNYASKTVTRVFNIEPSDEYTIDIIIPDIIIVGDNVTVNLTAPIQITNVSVQFDNGDVFVVNLTNGEGQFNLTNIVFGNHKITVTYNGDDLYYKAKTFEREFNVKINPILEVNINGIVYGENALIEVSVFDEDIGLSGIVLVTINETKYYVSLENGHGSLPVTDLTMGNYVYQAKFIGDDNYNSVVSSEYSFIVSPRAVFIDIDTREGANYHENGEVKVFLYDYVTGERIIADVELIFTDSGGSEIYRINVTSTTKEHGHSGSAVIESMNWEIGKYNITVYNPNYIFLQEEDEPVTYTFTLYDENKETQYAQGTFEVTDDERDDGFIEIKVLNSDVDTYIGNVYYIESDSLSLDGVTLHALFEFDEQTESIVPVDFWTTLSQLPVSYEFTSYEYNGEYTEYGHGTFNTTGIIDGDFTQIIVLDYNVSAGYVGQYFYINFIDDNEGYFKVYTKINNQFVDSGFYVTVSEVENGPKEFECVEYIVHKTYLYDEDVSIFEGDGEYLYNTPHNVILELTYDGQFVDITCTGTVTVCSWDDGNLIEIDTPFTVNFINGVAEFTLPVITPGEYVLKVNITDDSYELVRWGDDELLNYTLVCNFNVAEDHVYINDEFVNGVSEGLFRDMRIFNFTLWHNYELGLVEVDEPFAYNTYANVTVYRWNSENDDYEIVDTYKNIRIEILDGISESIDLTDLSAGDYKITVTLDDEYYEFNEWDDDIQCDVDYKSFYFNIEEDNPYIHTINWKDWINYGQDYTINFTLMHNNEEVLVYDTLANVTLYKIINNNNADEYVPVSSTLAGINDGCLSDIINWTALDAGNYKVTVSLEDQYYTIHDWDQGMEVNYQTFWFNINRANPIVDFTVPHDLVYGDDLTFTINITGVYGETLNETVHVFIENYNFNKDILLIDGFNSTTISDLNAGTYVVFLSFEGNTNYESYNGWHSAYVDKYTPDITVDVDSINYGEYPEFNINLIGIDNASIDGAVLIITVNNQYVYIKNTNNGNVHFTVDEIYAVGEYNVTVAFTGNNNYNSYTNDSESFNVLAGDSGFTAVIKNPNIEYLNDLVITVNTTANGKVYIILKDDTVYKQFNVTAGVSELNISGLGVGLSDNSARVIFEADNYQTQIVPIAYKITKATTGISLVDEEINITMGEDAEIQYSITPGIVEGNVTLWINNIVYGNYPITQSNGSIIITKDKLPSNGTYIIKVQFIDATGNYMDSNTDELTVNVAKINVTSNVTVTGSEIIYGEDAVVTVVFNGLSDVEGIVVVILDGVNGAYVGVVSDGSAVVPIRGLKGNQTYHINTIEYSGDNRYDSFIITSESVVKVNQARSVVSIDEIVDVTYPGDVIVNYNIVNETTVTVTVVDIKGTVISEGINTSVEGTVNIIGLNPGKYSIIINNTETTNYRESSASKTFYVFKEDGQIRIDPVIVLSDIGGCVGDIVSVNVTIAGGDATGYIIYNGLSYTVNNGVAVIPVKLLTAGMQSITVIYTGDAKYNNGSGVKAFNVRKAPTIITLVEDEINATVGSDVEIEYCISPDDLYDGNVSLWINDELYDTFPVTQSDGSILILSEYLPVNGTYIIKVQYLGTTDYEDSNNDSLVLNIVNSDVISIEIGIVPDCIHDDDFFDISIAIDNADGGNVTVAIPESGFNNTFVFENKTIVLSFKDFPAGSYNIAVNYIPQSGKTVNKTQLFNIQNWNFTELQKLIDEAIANNESSVDLEHDYVCEPGEKPITINDTIKINGNDHTIDVNNNNTCAFNISADGVELNSMTIINVNNGTVIDVAGNNTKLSDITLTDNNGTGIRIEGNNATVGNIIGNNHQGDLITVTGDDNNIAGTAVNGGNGTGIRVKGDNNTVEDTVGKYHEGNLVNIDGNNNTINNTTAQGGNGTIVDILNGTDNTVDGVSLIGHDGESVIGNSTNNTIENICENVADNSLSKLEYQINKAFAEGKTTFDLDQDYEFSDGDAPINVPEGMIINGNGHTINATGHEGVFDITNDNVTLNNLTITNVNGMGIIAVADNFKADGINLTNNTGTGINIIGNGCDIENIISNNHICDLIKIDGDNASVNEVEVICGNGTGIEITGDNAKVTNIDLDNHTGEGVIINGNNALVEALNAFNATSPALTINGNNSHVDCLGLVNQTGTGVIINGCDNSIAAVTVNGGNGTGIYVKGNNNTVVDTVGNDYNGTLVEIDGNNNTVNNSTANGGNGTIVNIINGTYNAVDGIVSNNHTGEVLKDNGNNTNASHIDTGLSPDKVFDLSGANADPAVFGINLPGDANGVYTVTIDGKDYITSVVNGKSDPISVPGLSSGVHNVGLKYTGDKKYSDVFWNKNINVPAAGKKATRLVAKKKITFKKKKRSKTKTFKFTLKSNGVKVSGKKVFFKLNKKALKTIKVKAKKGKKAKKAKKILKKLKKGKYSVKTKRGVAKLKLLKSLFKFKKGKGKITATFKGDASYIACKKVMKIVIK